MSEANVTNLQPELFIPDPTIADLMAFARDNPSWAVIADLLN